MSTDKLIFSEDQGPIYESIENAKEFIKIIAFQLTSNKIIDLLTKRAHEGIKIEVITLPIDSFNKPEKREEIAGFYADLQANNVEVDICNWEVGDASLTDTSQSGQMAEGGGEKWYSMHGKFIVTDQNALLLSANLIDQMQWDVYLTIYNENQRLFLLDDYDRMRQLFILPSKLEKKLQGQLFDRLPADLQQAIQQEWKIVQRKNIKEYPPNLSPPSEITSGLKISPFDGRARDFFSQFINDAKEYIYICSERIYDEESIEILKQKVNTSDVDIRILARPPQSVRQSIQKAKEQVLDLLAFDVNFRSLDNIHAKLWLSENWLMVGSCNITKMNLGFKKAKNFWRGNTETLYFTNDADILAQAKSEFEKLFESSISGISSTADERHGDALFKLYSAKSTKDARRLLSEIILYLQIKSKKNLKQIVKYAIKVAEGMQSAKIEELHVAMAYLLFEIQFKAQTEAELIRAHSDFLGEEKLKDAIMALISSEYCIFADGQLVLNINQLLK